MKIPKINKKQIRKEVIRDVYFVKCQLCNPKKEISGRTEKECLSNYSQHYNAEHNSNSKLTLKSIVFNLMENNNYTDNNVFVECGKAGLPIPKLSSTDVYRSLWLRQNRRKNGSNM